jgi:hypothetical protein
LVSGQATRGDEDLIGGIGKVSSIGFGAECEREDVADSRNYHSVQVYTFR